MIELANHCVMLSRSAEAHLLLDGSVRGHVDVGHDGGMIVNSANGVSSTIHSKGLVASQASAIRRCDDRIMEV